MQANIQASINVLSAQRNRALDEVAHLAGVNSCLADDRLAAYGLLRDIIRSGLIPDDQAAGIVERDQRFSSWYKAQP